MHLPPRCTGGVLRRASGVSPTPSGRPCSPAPRPRAENAVHRKRADLLVDGAPKTEISVAHTHISRAVGLMGGSFPQPPLWIDKASSVHTFGMRFAIDVAFVDRAGAVIDVVSMRPWRIGRPRRGCVSVLEAVAGTFDDLGIARSSVLSLRAPDWL
ncbi:MAG: DUF192 domain-containing protein [Acidimicrobiales bacterium]